MGCRVRQGLAVTFTLLTIGAAGIWVRSHFARDYVYWHRRGENLYERYTISTTANAVFLLRLRIEGHSAQLTALPTGGVEFGRAANAIYFGGRMRPLEFAGFQMSSQQVAVQPNQSTHLPAVQSLLRLPLWAICTLCGMLSAAGWFSIYRARRARRSPTACKSCGYDLRAGHEKCPECGADSHVKASVSV